MPDKAVTAMQEDPVWRIVNEGTLTAAVEGDQSEQG